MPRPNISAAASKSPAKTFFYVFAALYVVAILYFRYVSYNDPSSLFFDPTTAYTRHYSELRRQQAEEYITTASNPNFGRHRGNATLTELCVGITGITHDPARRFDFALGSLLEGLTKFERDRLRVFALLQANGPSPVLELYQPWLSNLVDATYDDPRSSEVGQLLSLLEICQKMGAPYTAIFSSDIIAMDGWLHRSLAALDELEGRTTSDGKTSLREDFLYLSLFYSEASLGWSSDDLTSYILGSIAFFTFVAFCIFTICTCYPTSKLHLTKHTNLAILLICTPLVIALYFAAGKVTVSPPSDGIAEETPSSLSSQGFVLPRDKVDSLLKWQEQAAASTVAGFLEEYANEFDGMGWVLRPAVIQHIGTRVKNGEVGNQESRADEVFNFGFEHYDPERLSGEHREAMRQQGFG